MNYILFDPASAAAGAVPRTAASGACAVGSGASVAAGFYVKYVKYLRYILRSAFRAQNL